MYNYYITLFEVVKLLSRKILSNIKFNTKTVFLLLILLNCRLSGIKNGVLLSKICQYVIIHIALNLNRTKS